MNVVMLPIAGSDEPLGLEEEILSGLLSGYLKESGELIVTGALAPYAIACSDGFLIVANMGFDDGAWIGVLVGLAPERMQSVEGLLGLWQRTRMPVTTVEAVREIQGAMRYAAGADGRAN